MADIKEAIRRLIYEYVVEGADKVMATQEAVAASTTKTDKASLSLEKAFGSLERRYVDTVRHQQDYAKVQEKVNAAVAQNPALQERANAVLAAASDHFDKLAFNANKGGIASSFLSKAISAVLGPAGLMGAAMTAVGVAVGYMAAQFQSASTTIEQALAEQNRLLKEAKNLIDAKTSAEAKAATQSRELTTFQLERSERDLKGKISSAMDAAAIAARGRSTRPTQVAGEMGEAPTGVASLGPGYEQIADAVEKLNAAMKDGQPGLAEFQTELAKVGSAYPELAQTAEELIKIGASGIQAEQAALRLRAISDALKGIATDAQLAAVGLGSIAQFKLSNLQAEQAAAATERQAQFTLQIAAMYPGMSVEVSKQLYGLEQELTVAQARTGAEKMAAQEIATQNNLLAQNKTLEEAIAIAAGRRAIAQANANRSIDDQIQGLQDSIRLINAYDEDRMKGQLAYEKALRETGDEEKAQQIGRATQQEAEARTWAHIVAKRYEDERRRNQAEADAAAARRRANNEAIAAINEQNAYLAQQRSIYDDIVRQIDFAVSRSASFDPASGRITITSFGNTKTWTDPSGKDTQFDPAGYQSTTTVASQQIAMAQAMYGEGGYATTANAMGGVNVTATATGIENVINKTLGKGGSIQGAIMQAMAQGDAGIGIAQSLTELLPKEQQASAIQQMINQAQRGPRTLANETLIKSLTDKLKDLTESTDALNTTMQNALSPYYSQDPRTTKLGFRAGTVGNPDWLAAGASNANPLAAILGPGATLPGGAKGFANGGSFVVPGGYSATDNRIAAFPVASGEQVVVNRRPGGQTTEVHNDNRIIINGNVDDDTLSKLKVTRFQQAQRMRSAMSAA